MVTKTGTRRNKYPCHACGAVQTRFITSFEKLHQVTSDCKPWHKGGVLLLCNVCKLIQKPTGINHDISLIYKNYSIYHQGNGSEQLIYDAAQGSQTPRSAHLVDVLNTQLNLPEAGTLLDIGCGNGAFLRHFLARHPKWRVVGHELDSKFRKAVEQIAGPGSYHTGNIHDLYGLRFDVISLIHCLEHIPHPASYLKSLHTMLNPDGILLVQTPSSTKNPFDLLIADHVSHFSHATLTQIMRHAGFEPNPSITHVSPREFTMIAKPVTPYRASTGNFPSNKPKDAGHLSAKALVMWLFSALTDARRAAKNHKIGVFGTSIAAVWLLAELGSDVSFFVDEDLNRINRTLFGRHVYHPNDVPEGSVVFAPITTFGTKALITRMQSLSFTFLTPSHPLRLPACRR